MKLPKVFIYGNKNYETHNFDKLDSIVQEEFERIDDQADKKKEEIEYLAEITVKYWDKLVKIFNPDNKIHPNLLNRMLFDQTKLMIEHIEENKTGLTSYAEHGDPEDAKYPEVLLGWIDVRQTTSGVYVLCLTEEGTEILNRIKEIREKNKK